MACAAPVNNPLLTSQKKYDGVGGHLFAVAIRKSIDYGYDGVITGVAANAKLLCHYIKCFNAEYVGTIHPYHFYINEKMRKLLRGDIIMMKQTLNFENYYKSLKNMEGPFSPDELRKVKMDLKGLSSYCISHNTSYQKMSEDERRMFVQPLEDNG